MDSAITFQEVTVAVQQLSSIRAPGIDGLPVEFYKHFWGLNGKDFFEVLKKWIEVGTLSDSCQPAALTLLPKKGDLSLQWNLGFRR